VKPCEGLEVKCELCRYYREDPTLEESQGYCKRFGEAVYFDEWCDWFDCNLKHEHVRNPETS
jgi:hypothetical protein